jgi:hypothetical protein
MAENKESWSRSRFNLNVNDSSDGAEAREEGAPARAEAPLLIR